MYRAEVVFKYIDCSIVNGQIYRIEIFRKMCRIDPKMEANGWKVKKSQMDIELKVYCLSALFTLHSFTIDINHMRINEQLLVCRYVSVIIHRSIGQMKIEFLWKWHSMTSNRSNWWIEVRIIWWFCRMSDYRLPFNRPAAAQSNNFHIEKLTQKHVCWFVIDIHDWSTASTSSYLK